MKKLLLCLSVSSCLVASSAFADDAPRARAIGMTFDVGVPDGAALGVMFRPLPRDVPWLKLAGAATYNGIAPGLRGSLVLDPIKFPITPYVQFDVGHAFSGTIPGTDKSPDVSYTYENILVGPAFGSQNGFRFFLLGGLTHVNVDTGNFQKTVSISNGATVGNPSFNGWAAPSMKLGFSVLF